MKIVIVGAGMIGAHIARELIDEKRDVVLIEKDPEAARAAANELDCLVLNEDGSRPEVLAKAGAGKASWFLALTGSDEVNIVACGLAASTRPSARTVARVVNPFYSSLSAAQRKALGIDVIINPSFEAADTVARIVAQGFAEDVTPLHGGKLQLRHGPPGEGFPGRSLGEIKAASGRDFLIAAVAGEGRFEIPSGDYMVRADDSLYALGKPADLDAFMGPVADLKRRAERFLIVGATAVGEHLIERLMERDHRRRKGFGALSGGKPRIVLIDSSLEKAKRAGHAFPDVEVIHGDSSEEGVLESAGVERADLFVCATPSQTYNILTAQLAKSLGAAKSVAISLNDRYSRLGESLDVDALVSMKNVTAAAVLSQVRKANIRTIHSFHEDDVEIVELEVGSASPAAGKRIMDLSLPKGSLVAFSVKGGKISVPSGATLVEGGDSLGFIVRKDSISRIESIFGGKGGS
jgi:trk system potassium uptake protein TrkA